MATSALTAAFNKPAASGTGSRLTTVNLQSLPPATVAAAFNNPVATTGNQQLATVNLQSLPSTALAAFNNVTAGAGGEPNTGAAAAATGAAADDTKARSDLFDENGMPRVGKINGRDADADPRFDDSQLGKDVDGEIPRSTQGLMAKLTPEQKAQASIDNLLKFVKMPPGSTYAEKLSVAALLQRSVIEGYAMGIDIPAQFAPGGAMEGGITIESFNPSGGTGGHFGPGGDGELHGQSFDVNNGDDAVAYTTFTHEFTGHGALGRDHSSNPSSVMYDGGDGTGNIPGISGSSNSPLPDWDDWLKETYDPSRWGRDYSKAKEPGKDLKMTAQGPLWKDAPDHSKGSGVDNSASSDTTGTDDYKTSLNSDSTAVDPVVEPVDTSTDATDQTVGTGYPTSVSSSTLQQRVAGSAGQQFEPLDFGMSSLDSETVDTGSGDLLQPQDDSAARAPSLFDPSNAGHMNVFRQELDRSLRKQSPFGGGGVLARR
jgi:hypothetical protein